MDLSSVDPSKIAVALLDAENATIRVTALTNGPDTSAIAYRVTDIDGEVGTGTVNVQISDLAAPAAVPDVRSIMI